MTIKKHLGNYQNLIHQISAAYLKGQDNTYRSVNEYLVKTYWQIGKYIVEFEQDGKEKAVYGKGLVDNLVKDLSERYGKGFSRSNLIYMRRFFWSFK